jgi:hypothetical protein
VYIIYTPTIQYPSMSSFTANSSTTKTDRKVLEFADWNPKAYKFMAPKVNEKGGKSVSLISTQTSRSLHLNTPLLMTWGPGDFSNDDGTSDGKFKLPLNFPNDEYKTESTEQFKQKMLELQTSIIDAAVSNSELWFGKAKSRETVEDNFFPFMKYPKVKDGNGKPTSKIDYSKPPSSLSRCLATHKTTEPLSGMSTSLTRITIAFSRMTKELLRLISFQSSARLLQLSSALVSG